jgi:hypothetical protein
MDGTNGQITCHRTLGQSRKWGVWNAYNRQSIVLQEADPTNTWTYTTATIRPSNGSTANSITTFTGLPEEAVAFSFSQICEPLSTGAGNIGIGINSTTAYVAGSKKGTSSIVTNSIGEMYANYIMAPTPGSNVATALENAPAATNTQFFGSANSNMLMTASYRG